MPGSAGEPRLMSRGVAVEVDVQRPADIELVVRRAVLEHEGLGIRDRDVQVRDGIRAADIDVELDECQAARIVIDGHAELRRRGVRILRQQELIG